MGENGQMKSTKPRSHVTNVHVHKATELNNDIELPRKRTNSEVAEHKDKALKALNDMKMAEIEINLLKAKIESLSSSLECKEFELIQATASLKDVQALEPEYKAKLADSEKTIAMLSDKRECLLRELKATKKVLISSLNTINHLEVEVAKVPGLEARIVELEGRMKKNKEKQWNIGTASEEDLFSSNIALGGISKVFNQLEVLENKMKDSPTAQDRSITTFLAEHFERAETEDSIATSCPMLPDYLVVRTVVTEDSPVAATAATMVSVDSQGQDIPVRLTVEHLQPLSRRIPIEPNE